MSRILLAAGVAGLLSACASMPDWGWLPGHSGPGLASGERQYDFRWRLSGDRAVAPLQVFDDGRRTWMQFAPGQAVPAIFRGGARGDQPLDYRRAGPYVVLDGVWPKLVLRGGGLRGVVERAEGAGMPVSAAPAQPSAAASPAKLSPAALSAQSSIAGPAAALSTKAVALSTKAEALSTKASAAVAAPSPFALRSIASPATGAPAHAAVPPAGRRPAPAAARPAAHAAAAPIAASTAGSIAKPLSGPAADSTLVADPTPVALAGAIAASYEVGPQDGNLRQALSRWAHAAGWTFEPEHWAVDADIPITGSARFGSGFKRSVQDLVASTELSEKPLQPCFYSNKVLRIVPYAQACDRSADPARVS